MWGGNARTAIKYTYIFVGHSWQGQLWEYWGFNGEYLFRTDGFSFGARFGNLSVCIVVTHLLWLFVRERGGLTKEEEEGWGSYPWLSPFLAILPMSLLARKRVLQACLSLPHRSINVRDLPIQSSSNKKYFFKKESGKMHENMFKNVVRTELPLHTPKEPRHEPIPANHIQSE